MARARNIKPGFFRNADLLELPMEARLLFVGLWTLADREGRMEDRPKQIKIEIFPADDVDCEKQLQALAQIGMVARYEVDGKRFLQVTNFAKHQNPHRDEKASTVPDQNGNTATTEAPTKKHRANTVQTQCKEGAGTVAIGLNPDSGFLNPDPGTLIADSLIPDCSTNTSFAAPPAEAASGRPKRVKAEKQSAPSAETWDAYRQAYAHRYGAQPVRNATVNGQLAQFVGRLGGEEAPSVAAWYVSHKNQFYVSSGHSIGVLLRDCEKLRTEWATGQQRTMTQAIQADRTQTNFNAFAGLIDEAKAKEKSNAEY